MNTFRTVLTGSLVIASLVFVGSIAHAQTDPYAPGSVPLGGTCTITDDCSHAYVCYQTPGNAHSTCQVSTDEGGSAPSAVGNTSTAQNSPQTSATAIGNTSTGVGIVNPLNASSLTGLLQEILSYVVMLGSIFLTLMLVYVGFLFVSAQGSDEKIRTARTALMWTVVGGLLLLGASALAQVITATVQGL